MRSLAVPLALSLSLNPVPRAVPPALPGGLEAPESAALSGLFDGTLALSAPELSAVRVGPRLVGAPMPKRRRPGFGLIQQPPGHIPAPPRRSAAPRALWEGSGVNPVLWWALLAASGYGLAHLSAALPPAAAAPALALGSAAFLYALVRRPALAGPALSSGFMLAGGRFLLDADPQFLAIALIAYTSLSWATLGHGLRTGLAPLPGRAKREMRAALPTGGPPDLRAYYRRVGRGLLGSKPAREKALREIESSDSLVGLFHGQLAALAMYDPSEDSEQALRALDLLERGIDRYAGVWGSVWEVSQNPPRHTPLAVIREADAVLRKHQDRLKARGVDAAARAEALGALEEAAASAAAPDADDPLPAAARAALAGLTGDDLMTRKTREALSDALGAYLHARTHDGADAAALKRARLERLLD